jgi:polyisoprenyl-phosphate glycosyltransferase
MSTLPAVTLVIPVFNEESVLPELILRLDRLFSAHPGYRWKVLIVDDGSRDGTVPLIADKVIRDQRYRLLELSRNFGHQAALAAGLAHTSADAVITLDADLQDPPELIPELLAAWQKGADVVRAARRSRRESGVRRLGFELFHRFFGAVSDFPIEPNTGTFGLLSRPALEAFNQLPEKHRFFPGLRSWIGFNQAEVFYDRAHRAAGRPQQTLYRLMKYAFDGVFSFSYLPLRVLTYSGVLIGGFGFVLGAFFAIRRIIGIEIAATGFTTMVTLILFLGGVQLVGIGILGEYLGRIYDEVKQRPTYLVKRKLGID